MTEEISESTDDCRKELKCIGLRVAYFHKLKNITQATLAERLSINKNYLSHIESGSANKAVSLPLLIRISKAHVGEFVKDMRQTFEEMKQLNSELDKKIITDYYYDITGHTTAMNYTPDINTLNSVIRQWHIRGIDFIGFVHSHSACKKTLSLVDIRYAEKIKSYCGLTKIFMLLFIPTDQSFHQYII